jgi:DNA-directed RNA polymerase specialized sigma24 family protein
MEHTPAGKGIPTTVDTDDGVSNRDARHVDASGGADPAHAHATRIAAEIAALEPLIGTPAFWVRVENPAPFSCEALLYCAWQLEQRAPADALQLEELVVRRVQGRIHAWTWYVGQTKMHGHLTAAQCEELEEECLVRMIGEWREHKPGWLRFFATALSFCQQHTLEAWAVKEGYWSRAAERAQRIPRRLLASLDAPPPWEEAGDDAAGAWRIADPEAEAALERADYLDLLLLLAHLDEPARLAVTLDIQDVPRQEIGRILGITQVTLRKRLRQAYADIAARYQPEQAQT